MSLISIIIPVYNSTNSLKLLAKQIDVVFNNLEEDYEIIFVDDKSQNDETWPILETISKSNTKIKAIQLTRNFGQQAATLCGFENAKGEYIVTMDDDLQHNPADIPVLLSKKNHDIVIGSFKSKKHNVFKRFTSKIKGYFDRIILGKPKNIQITSFKLINRIVIDGMLKIKTAFPFIPALMFYVSKDIVSVNVSHNKRFEGKTNYSLFRMIKLFSNLIISNSSLLLKIIGIIGITISLLSFIYAIIIIVRKLFYDIDVIGWASNIVAILFLGGLILFTLGIIGEYLIRVIIGVEQKPTYFIRHKKNL